MVDFRKKLSKGEIDKKINPLEIYDNLDRRSVTGPLRPAQSLVLEEWYDKRKDEKDLIVKLHTGEGKTLIGLLILQSKLNQGAGPCIFVCPNIYLVNQVALEAQKFGIPFCLIDGGTNEIPNEFHQGKKILITHVQKIFNGKSIFGIDNNYIPVGCIILDDSHACIDSIKDSFTITIKREYELFEKLINLFENDLREQGEGSFLDIKAGAYDTLLTIPYWSWIDRKSEVVEILEAYKNENFIKFVWPIIRNSIENCQVFVTGNIIEIVPYHIPIRSFGTFSQASQRILMSATTQDDSFFIKGLGFNIGSVKNPLINPMQKWSGEKMVLIPSLLDEKLDRNFIVEKFAKPVNVGYGRVALVSSFSKSEEYKYHGSDTALSQDIFDKIRAIKSGNNHNTLVIVNRYDGIDLPDEACRILIFDSLPYFNSLSDRYEEQCRLSSDIINIKMAQKIEQGLGRSVRGEKDYSVILLIGADLVKFIKSIRTNKYFSKQTLKQIELGFEIAEMGAEDIKDNDASKVLMSLINQSINRDEGWKEFYKEEMDKTSSNEPATNIYNILQLEKDAEEANYKGDNEKACQKIQSIIDNEVQDSSERGWYLQILSRYMYFISKTESNKMQKSAFNNNLQLLKPRDGVTYKKIQYINENRIKRIKDYISQFNNYDELILSVDSILSDFSFGIDAEKFEGALQEIGSLLGFISQRPDKEIKKGPDNLWCGVDNKYFLIECKASVLEEREEINKHEAGQMNSHCGWFEEEYGQEVKVKRILIIPTKNVSYFANFTHKVEVMRKGKLKSFKSSILGFIKEFKNYNIHELSDETIQQFINMHNLDIANLESLYTETYYQRTK
ncbi:DEAD/DEAH box helicase [Flavobacterium hauense]